MNTQQTMNSPEVVGVILALAVAGVILIFAVVLLLHTIDRVRSRRRDTAIFKTVREARRHDFR